LSAYNINPLYRYYYHSAVILQAYGCSPPSYFDSDPDPVNTPPEDYTAACVNATHPKPSYKCHYRGNKLCAAVNRGVLDIAFNETNPKELLKHAFKVPPYNVYSAAFFAKCPKIYTFAYDDTWNPVLGTALAIDTGVDYHWCPDG